jgi:hypothetical protein
MKVVTRWSLVLALLLGCGGDGSDKGDDPGTALGDGDGDDDDGDAPMCVDLDQDGHGEGCEDGPDCDDRDDTIFEACDTCMQVREGCACDDDAEPVECKIPTGEIVDGVLLCKVGTRYCRDGVWTACIGIISFAE